ncbi:MAG: ABC transporter ATP-binding protein [Candidatus Omnitrophota bacterium]
MNDYLIKANKIVKKYELFAETIYALNKVELEVKRGDYIAIMGPSGSGKTTLLDIVGCLMGISEGELRLFGRDVSRVKENELVKIRRGNFGFVFQEFLLVPTLTALENVELALVFARITKPQKELVDILNKFGLSGRINHLPKELSGGERQRVAIARAVAVSPKILIADEPTGNLDTKNSQDVFNLFRQLNKEDKLTIIVATHDERFGSQASQTIRLQDGKVVSREENGLIRN